MQETNLCYNQLALLWHLARFNLLHYEDCLEMLKMPNRTGRKELSYAFRPLTKNGYISKGKGGCVSILAKGRALYSEATPLISTGGGERERKRVMQVSRMAMWMAEHGFPAEEALGILSTSRFVGMLVGCGHRLAVYDIGNGRMDWQRRQAGILASWNRKTMSVENLIETTCYPAQQRFAEPWNVAECVELMNKFSMVRGVHGGVL